MDSTDPRARLAALSPLVARALDLDTVERAAWLAALREDAPALAASVEALLAGEAGLDASGFLMGAPDTGSPAAAAGASLAGRQVGAYTMERPLGRGGMGSVWLARRSDGRYEGRVAIKLLTLALLTPAGIERFRREGSALARLTHPNIARLIDAGVIEAGLEHGQPYLVLEFVDGERLDRYCADHRLGTKERLVLFQQVLAAVAHAHAHLIVHRDLKPSNVLVTRDGVVKLVDFGIAKLVVAEEGEGERTALTEVGGGPLTPEYAAPEQVQGEPVTVVTDVYALGVLLYVLLSGVHPTGPAALTTGEQLRHVLDTEPARLSDAVPGAAGRQYAGDLDNIVAKALRKEPSERYATVAAFADDIGRHLRVEPVLARPATLRYRAGKFFRRYHLAVSAGIAAALVLIAATGVAVSQAREARRQRDAATRQRDQAVYEQRRATASSRFMRHLLQSVAPAGGAFTSQQLLDRGREVLETDYGGDPRFVARMLIELADGYYELVDRRTVLELLARAETLATVQHDPETAAYASCRTAETQGDGVDVAAARANLARAQGLLAGVPAPGLDVRAACLRARAVMASQSEHPDSGAILALQAVELLRTAGDSSSDHFQLALSELEEDLFTLHRTRDALEASRQALAALTRGGRGRTLAAQRELWGEAYYLDQLGEPRQADSVLNLAADMAAAIDPPHRWPAALSLLAGEVQLQLGRADSAASAFGHALAEADRQGDANWIRWASTGLTAAQIDAGRWPEARRGVEHTARPLARRLLEGRLAAASGQVEVGQRLLIDALVAAGFPGEYKPPHNMLKWAVLTAETALAAGDPAAADSLAGHVLRLARLQGDRDHRSATIGRALAVRGRVALARADTAAAGEALRHALSALRQALGPEHDRTRAVATALGTMGP